MDLALCRPVLAACPNVRCCADIGLLSDSFVKQRVLGPFLKSMSIGIDVAVDENKMTALSRECTAVECISLEVANGDAAKAIRGLLFREKPRLRKIALKLEGAAENTSGALRELGARAGTQEEFSLIWFFHDRLDKGAFQAIVDGAPGLHFVHVYREMSNFETDRETKIMEEVDFMAEHVVDCFLKCPCLRNLEVNHAHWSDVQEYLVPKLDVTSDKCVRLRHNKGPFFVKVFEKDFM